MKWQFFDTAKELTCKCGCGQMKMEPDFMEKLVDLREACGFPFIVTSAYRCPAHNRAVGGGVESAHLEGRAVDISIYGPRGWTLTDMAKKFRFTGIGWAQSPRLAPQSRFIHLDDAPATRTRPRPWIWSY